MRRWVVPALSLLSVIVALVVLAPRLSDSQVIGTAVRNINMVFGAGLESTAQRVTLPTDGTGQVILGVADNNFGNVDVLTMPTDSTELPAIAALADATANLTVPSIGVFLHDFNGTTWDRTQLADDAVEDTAEAGADKGPLSITVRRDVAAASAGTSGDFATQNTDALGLTWARFLDPCSGVSKLYVAVDIVTATTTEIIDQDASNKIYICSIFLYTSAANNFAIVEDTTDACANPDAALAGGFAASAADGFLMVANQGFTMGNGNGTVMRTSAVANNVCLITSTTAQLSGVVAYALAP